MGFVVPLVAAAGTAIAGAIGTVGTAAAAASATTVAGTALTLGQIGTAVSVAGSVYGGVSAYQAGQYQAKVLNMQAAYAEEQRGKALAAGAQKESMLKTQIARVIGSQRAAEAGNGVDVDVGSSVDIADSTALEGAADVATTHYQAMQEAYGLSQDAWNAKAGASAAKASGKNALIGSLFDAGGTFLSGASSLAKKRFAYGQVGIGGKPGSINDILKASPQQRLSWGS